MSDKPKIIVICGPTASGKTKLGIEVANKIDGEIVSCDSMQIYKDMNIGTAKPTEQELKQAKHHLVDFVSPEQRYSVADFKNDATTTIKDIIKRGKNPILVGGTGLYIDSLIYNIEFKEEQTDFVFREQMESLSSEELYNKAKQIDKIATEKISQNDRKRLIRILELYHSTGKTKTELEAESRKKLEYEYIIFVLNMDREKLYERINNRVDLMISAGLVEEVKSLLNKYKDFPTAMQGLGYKEVVEYLNDEISENEMIEKIKQESRRYAKRQLTWFRRYKNAIWINAEDTNNVDTILEEISEKN